MEHLPLEVIGMILSGLEARDSVIASTTCKKWREAWQNHLHSFSFNSNTWPGYFDLIPSELEFLITKTIFQTKGLQCLSISLDEVAESTVVSCIMHTRDTLRNLHCDFDFGVCMTINILEKCDGQKLQVLSLERTSLPDFEPSYQKFPYLKSLSLRDVCISALDLSLLLTACPKLEVLILINPEFEMSKGQTTIELSSPSLKDIYVEGICRDKFILEADSLENLQLKNGSLRNFELCGKGALRVLKIDGVKFGHCIGHLIGENMENLEIVDVSNTTMWPKIYKRISKSSNLRRFRLWDVDFVDGYEVMDLETISDCFPQLSHLSLSCDLIDGVLQYNLQGSSHFENLIVLELGWTLISDLFSDWVAGVVQRCPNLKKLVINGAVSGVEKPEEFQILANISASIVQLMRRYTHVEIKFKYN